MPLNTIDQFGFVLETRCVFFEVRTEYQNTVFP
jgi:hypothetical protein